MKKRVRLLSGMLSLILSVTALAGCSSSGNAEGIIDKAISELKDIASMNTEMEMLMDVSVVSGKTSINMNMEMNLSMDQIIEDQITHGEGYLKMEALGTKEETEVEMYIFKEDGDFVQYTNTDGYWTSSELEDGDSMLINSKELWQGFKEAEGLKHTGTDKVDGSKTEVIEGKIGGKTLEEAMSLLSATDSDVAMFGDVDLSKTEIVMEAQFYQDSGLPARMSIDLSSVLEEMMKSEEYSSELMGMEVEIEDFNMTFTFSDYNDIGDIKIPDDVDEYSYDDDDGSYIEGVENPTGPWESYEFTLNQKTYTLPVAYSEFTAAGWEIDSSSNGRIKVAAESSEEFIDVVNEKGDIITLSFYNDSKEEKAITDCVVVGVRVDEYYTTDLDFSLSGGVKIGMSEDELNSIYKEYTDIYDSSYSKSYYYYGADYYDYDMVYISLSDGKIESLSMDHK